MEKEYNNVYILELLKKYVENKLELRKKEDVIVFYDKTFYFNCVERSNMESIAKIRLSEILKSCNNVDCEDDKFLDKEDLLSEINQLVDSNNVSEYIAEYLRSVYGITCICGDC